MCESKTATRLNVRLRRHFGQLLITNCDREQRTFCGRTGEDVIISRISLKCNDKLGRLSDPLCCSSWSLCCFAAPSRSELLTCSLQHATALGIYLQSYRARSRSQSARSRKEKRNKTCGRMQAIAGCSGRTHLVLCHFVSDDEVTQQV